jgi:undecaprenyl diphosphate synthase
MDGNGRWAQKQNLKRIEGHKKGAEVVREMTTHCSKLGIEYITHYAFSTENWNRPKVEVDFLMRLLENYLKNEVANYLEHNIRFNVIGDLSKFSTKLQNIILQTQERTQHCSGLVQTIALNYGSQDEIIRAVKKLNALSLDVTEENLQKCLDTKDMPPVDLLIRTSGEYRLSNFLLWQSAYAELYFTQTLWPDFTENELDNIIEDYKHRERRFGGI